jgi:hypothetical protein
VLGPGGGHPGRAWPVESFAELARLLSSDGRASLMVIGGEADARAGGRIASSGAFSVAGKLTLRQSIALISRADLMICNSSFAMHAAAATGVHAIVLLGDEYESARAHAAQWGHDELTTVLGRDDDRPNIFEPAEVLDVVSSRREPAGSRHEWERSSSSSEVGRYSMSVVFITGGLEPNRDGVGDYTRWLAVESARRGASCRLLALADRHISAPVDGPDRSGLDALRLPFTMPWPDRLRAAKAFLASSPPDWVSLQFVPYSFQRWGVASTLVRVLRDLVGRSRLHVMFHEIWIDGGTSLRTRLVSAAQKRAILALAHQPRALVHTSNGTYQHALAQQGVHVSTLPLFGSIPVTDGQATDWLAPLLAEVGCHALSRSVGARSDWWLFVLFGTVHPVWPPQPLLDELQASAAAVGKRAAIISVGRLGAGEVIWTGMAEAYGARVPMLRLGEQPAQRISELFNSVDFGIATTPLALIGKSATVAAMFDHGLPVVVNRDDCRWPAPKTADDREAALVIPMGQDLAARLRNAQRLPAVWRLPSVAAQWLGEVSGVADKVPTWSS